MTAWHYSRTVEAAREAARPDWLPLSVDWSECFDSLLSTDIDVVVELVGGVEQARRWTHQALVAGKSVVTANKQLVAEHGPGILSLAARQGCALRFEGAVAGGIILCFGTLWALAESGGGEWPSGHDSQYGWLTIFALPVGGTPS